MAGLRHVAGDEVVAELWLRGVADQGGEWCSGSMLTGQSSMLCFCMEM